MFVKKPTQQTSSIADDANSVMAPIETDPREDHSSDEEPAADEIMHDEEDESLQIPKDEKEQQLVIESNEETKNEDSILRANL